MRHLRGSGRAAARKSNWAALAGLALVVLAYFVRCSEYWLYVNDDAFITFRYSHFLASGRGPYFNVGEHVEGYTNFLLMLAMVPVTWIGGPAAVPSAAKGIGVASGVGSLIVSYLLTRRVLLAQSATPGVASAVGVGAAGLVAVAPAYAVNSTSGLETTLFGLLVLLGSYASLRSAATGRWCGAGVAFGAALLTRPEGAFLFAVVWLAGVVVLAASGGFRAGGEGPRERVGSAAARTLAVDAAIVVAVFGAHLAFRLAAYDGEWLPNTYYAKSGGFWKIEAWRYVSGGLVTPLLGPVGVLLAAPGAVLAVRKDRSVAVLFAAAAAGASVPFITGTDWMPGWRLLMPYLPIAACAIAVGWATALLRVPWRAAPAAFVLGAALVSGGLQAPLHAQLSAFVAVRAEGYAAGHSALASWLCEEGRARPGDGIALMDIGIIGYRCDQQTILDISGLTDRTIAKTEGAFLRKDYDPAYVLDREPRFVIVALTARGRRDQPPPPGTKFTYWTRMERRLANHPEFASRYVDRPEAGAQPPGDWRESLARQLGAVRVFEHAHPNAYYLLAVFDAEARG